MKTLKLIILVTIITFSFVPIMAQQSIIRLIPEPVKIKSSEGSFLISNQLYIDLNFTGAMNEARELQNVILEKTGIKLRILKQKNENQPSISIIYNSNIKNREGYLLRINKNGVILESSHRAGLFYGIKSLAQLFTVELEGKSRKDLPYVNIEDYPRFEYRALMLDPARHFLPISGLKKYIDVMASYKFNYLHLHLTDDHGWRVEIKKYPLLTKIGSKRKQTMGDGRPHEGFYSQEELKNLVSYAKNRHVEIIPEIDMPGHGMSILAAYPNLACFPKDFEVSTMPGVSKELLCAGKEEVYEFYENVIAEVATIFPNSKMHIGGDEAPLDRWKESSHCQTAMFKLGLENEKKLMTHFFSRIGSILKKYNKEPMLWYESDINSYPKNSTAFLWRNEDPDTKLQEIKFKGIKMINSYGKNAYYDYPQWKGDGPHTRWMPVLSLEKAYDFDPVRGLAKSESEFIKGVEATIWGEFVPNIDRAFYMTYPRAFALSEVAWSIEKNRSWYKFKLKLDKHLIMLMNRGVHFRPPIELSDKYDLIKE